MRRLRYFLILITLILLGIAFAYTVSQRRQGSQPATPPAVVTEVLGADQLSKISQITATEDINSLILSADEKTLFVPSLDENLIYVIDTGTNAVTRTLTVEVPWAAALTQDGNRLFVTQGSNQISLVDPRSGRVLKSAPTGQQPHFLLLTPDEKLVIVVNYLSNNVNFFTVPDLQLLGSVPVGQRPRGAVFDAAAKQLFVANYAESSISAISLDSLTETSRIRFYGRPNQLFYSAAKNLLFATDSFNSQVVVINTQKQGVVGRVAVDKFPFGLSPGRDENELLVVGYEQNSIGLIDLETLTVRKTLQTERGFVGNSGFNLATYVPSQNKLFISNTLHGQVLVYEFR